MILNLLMKWSFKLSVDMPTLKLDEKNREKHFGNIMAHV